MADSESMNAETLRQGILAGLSRHDEEDMQRSMRADVKPDVRARNKTPREERAENREFERQRQAVEKAQQRLHPTSTPRETTEPKTLGADSRRGTEEQKQPLAPVATVNGPRDFSPIVSGRTESRARSADSRWDAGPDQGLIAGAVDNYMTVLSQRNVGKYRISPVSPPKFKAGGDWRCFLAEFKEMVRLADMRPSHQVSYLKQAVPEEAKRLLYQHGVETVEHALEILTELYQPVRDSWSVLQELQKITQGSGERLRVLAGRIQDAARLYAETVHILPVDLDQMVIDQFKYALTDEETRNQLLWDQTNMTLDAMVKKAQKYEDFRRSGGNRGRKALRTTEENPELQKVEKELAELKKLMAELQKPSRKQPFQKPTLICWNCGQKGHFSRDCKKEKVGKGFDHHPRNQRERQEKPGSRGSNSTQTEAEKSLN